MPEPIGPEEEKRAEAPASAARREAMLKLAKAGAYAAPATLGYLAATRPAAAS